ncbi:MAG: hypothetical protein RI891_854 [Gemmatimonadota bacterium]
MRVCDDDTMQDALPDYVQGRCADETAAVVRAHLASCAACAEEAELIAHAGEVIARATPSIATARILAEVDAAHASARPATPAPASTVIRTRRWWASRPIMAAAASILVVVSLSIPTLRGTPAGTTPEVALERSVGVDAPGRATTAPGAVTSVDLAGGLATLSSAQLEALLSELDALEGTVRAEPATIALPLIDTPELL